MRRKPARPTPAEIEYREREDRRIAQQRNLFTFLAPSRAVDALKAAMLERARDLMDNGQPECADALLEFLPSADATKMLDQWLDDEAGDTPPGATP